MKKASIFCLFLLSFVSHFCFASSSISGEIRVSNKLQKKLQKDGVLFIFARSANTPELGFPLAVKKVTEPKFPLQFTLSQEDSMVEGTRLEGAVTIVARFSPSGDVITKKGAFEGSIGRDKTVVVGQTKSVKVLIDQEL